MLLLDPSSFHALQSRTGLGLDVLEGTNKRKIQDVHEVGISIDLHATLLSLTIDLIGYDGILLPLLPRRWLPMMPPSSTSTCRVGRAAAGRRLELTLFLTQLLSGCAGGINSSTGSPSERLCSSLGSAPHTRQVCLRMLSVMRLLWFIQERSQHPTTYRYNM